jgi:GT2 family glycosyltransferase
MEPFITFYTPTYRRPHQLARCLESVRVQTAVEDVEQIVIPDHVGVGIGGMFARVREYVSAVHGRYVHLLADDDVLASPTVVEEVRAFAAKYRNPEVIIVATVKDGARWPLGKPCLATACGRVRSSL